MSSKSELSKVNALLVDLVASNGKTGRGGKTSRIGQEVEELASLDYAGPLRRCFDRVQLDAVIRDARRYVWPTLNRQPLRLGSTQEFSEHFSSIGVEIRPARMSSSTGLALLGFYVRKTDFLAGKPLICVNTAHHPAVIGAAFVHEMGHHLTAEIFGNEDNTPSLLYTGYSDHLDEPSELVADVLVSLGIYPRPMARKMFPRARHSGNPTNLDANGHSAVIDYLSRQYGLSFNDTMSVSKRLQYMAGLLHYTRLREALRNEFDL